MLNRSPSQNQLDVIDPNAVFDNLVNIQDPRFPLMWSVLEILEHKT